jgi:hypothetical protein
MDLSRRDLLALGGLTLASSALAPSVGRAQTAKRGGTLTLRCWDPPFFDQILLRHALSRRAEEPESRRRSDRHRHADPPAADLRRRQAPRGHPSCSDTWPGSSTTSRFRPASTSRCGTARSRTTGRISATTTAADSWPRGSTGDAVRSRPREPPSNAVIRAPGDPGDLGPPSRDRSAQAAEESGTRASARKHSTMSKTRQSSVRLTQSAPSR